MKISIYSLLISCLIISCSDDFLDVTSSSELSDATFWQTKNDADMALVGCYNSWEGMTNIVYFDGASDNYYDQFYGYKDIAAGRFNPTSVVRLWFDGRAHSNEWITYSRIRKYNTFLEKIENIDMDPDIKEQYKAEVRFLRAYDYYFKAQLYGAVPLVTKVLEINEESQPRSPVDQVEQFVKNELDEISDILPVQNNVDSGGHITAGAAIALKARMELYAGNYEQAMIEAKRVIDMPVYEINEDYRGKFLPGNYTTDKEAILSVNYANNYISTWFMLPILLPQSYGGFSALGATRSLVETYETTAGKPIQDPDSGYDPDRPFENRDARMEMTFLHPGQVWNGVVYNSLDRNLPDGSLNLDYNKDNNAARTGMNIIKYIDGTIPISDVPTSYGIGIVVIRLAEMYLTYAEAAVETGQNIDIALGYINELREIGNLPPATELTRELVRRERRVELAGEGLRYFDIKRWDIGSDALNGALYGSREGTVDEQGEVTWADTYLKVDERVFRPETNYLLPIPQNLVDNSGWEQNPGY